MPFDEAVALQNRASRDPNPFQDRCEDSPLGSVWLTKWTGHGGGGTLSWIVRMVRGSQVRHKSFEKLRSAHLSIAWHRHCYWLPLSEGNGARSRRDLALDRPDGQRLSSTAQVLREASLGITHKSPGIDAAVGCSYSVVFVSQSGTKSPK